MILGLSGWAGSGKDEAAKHLGAVYDFERVAFADRMRSALLALDPIVEARQVHQIGAPSLLVVDRLSKLVEVYGWDEAKRSSMEVRALLQRFGTDCVRHHLGDNTWVNATMADVDPDKRYVVTDVRFKNEARALADVGVVVRITRPGFGPANDHISEHDLDDWDFDHRIVNNGTKSELYAQLDDMLSVLAPEVLT